MKKTRFPLAVLAVVLLASPLLAKEHAGREYIEKNGYKGPSTCEVCHPDTARKFLDTVHWKHASKVTNVDNIDPTTEYGMKNRIYSFCNGNDIVNNLKETPKNGEVKTKLTGCNTCHPGDPGDQLHGVGSTGPAAEASIDCLVCHSADYDVSKRKPAKNDKGQVLMGQDRSVKAALAVGKPSVKNCMICHATAGGGEYIKRGFVFTTENDIHAAKGMSCADCHTSKDHRIPTGFDPNNWANDGVRIACLDCHGDKPHKDAPLNTHTARIACQTCHIPRTGGAFAKDFTTWSKGADGFFEPTTLKKEANETRPVYAWFNGTISNAPHMIGPKGSRKDAKSKIYPFKIYQAKAFFNKVDGKLLSMDFAQPMATGDTLAGVASAAKTLGITKYEPVAGWQTIYFASSHLVTKDKSLSCENCHAPNGVLNFKALGYDDMEVVKLTSPATYFEYDVKKQKEKEEW
ncbi:MAG TPA: cytochrome c3 family protein [Geobacteraceae bacterium]|nr:cytochrome c3 family protein [Geobacteraceae bacterium]